MRIWLMLWLCMGIAQLNAAETQPFSLARVQAAADSVAVLRLPFVQEKHLALLDEPLMTPGVIEVDRTRDAVRWEFTDQVVLIYRNGSVQRYGADGEAEDIPNPQAARSLEQQMRALLSGDWQQLDDYFTIAVDADAAQVQFIASDPALRQYIASLSVRFDQATLVPRSMTLHSASGDQTAYRFAPVETPDSLPAERFAGP